MVFIGAALDDSAGQFVAGPANVHGIFFFWVDIEPVTAVTAADGYALQFDQYLAIVGHRRFGF
jgi:hypothetical protein